MQLNAVLRLARRSKVPPVLSMAAENLKIVTGRTKIPFRPVCLPAAGLPFVKIEAPAHKLQA
jgi:hypothetical protein